MARGDSAEPLTLAEAMTLDRIEPGHTVWLRGGVYNTQSVLTCTLQGTAEAPITMRNVPGEVAQIDAALVLSCPYTRWMSDDYGLEVIGTAVTRETETPGSALPAEMGGHGGIEHAANGVDLINVRVLNTLSTGLSFFGSQGTIYGCHIIHNGRIAPDRTHGPGIYTHNNFGRDKRIENTVIVDSFRYGLQMYSASINRIWNYDVVDTVIIGPNMIASTGAEAPSIDDVNFTRLMMISGHPMLGHGMPNRGDRCALADSVVHHTEAFYAAKLDRLTISGCRFSSDRYTLVECEPTITDCAFGNLTGVDVNLVPNTYAPNFATLTVFDWDASGTVNIDVSAFVASGTVRVHNIILMRTEYRDVVVAEGVLALDMTGWTTPPPLGLDTILTDAYPGDFGCWILEKLA